MEKVWTLEKLKQAPPEIFVHILSQLDPQSLVNFCSASKEARIFCKPAWRDLFKRDFTKMKICDNPDWEKLYRVAASKKFSVYQIQTAYEGENGIKQLFVGKENILDNIRDELDNRGFEGDLLDELLAQIPKNFVKKVKKFGEGSFDIQDEDGEVLKVEVRYSGDLPIREVLRVLPQLKKKDFISGTEIELSIEDEPIFSEYTLEDDNILDVALSILESHGISSRKIRNFKEEYDGLGEYIIPEAGEYNYYLDIRDLSFMSRDLRKILPKICKMT